MSNKNIVLMLQDGLSSSTRQDIYPADLASLLGYGATQLKQYVKWAKAGNIEKPNERLERAAALAYRCGELEGFESLFPLIPKLSGELNDEEWFRRTGMRMDKMIRGDASTAGQLDLIESAPETENDHQNNDILWPEFVDASTRAWLKDFDREQLDFALNQKGELVVQRILAGYVKEQKQHALDNEISAIAGNE